MMRSITLREVAARKNEFRRLKPTPSLVHLMKPPPKSTYHTTKPLWLPMRSTLRLSGRAVPFTVRGQMGSSSTTRPSLYRRMSYHRRSPRRCRRIRRRLSRHCPCIRRIGRCTGRHPLVHGCLSSSRTITFIWAWTSIDDWFRSGEHIWSFAVAGGRCTEREGIFTHWRRRARAGRVRYQLL